MRESDETLKKQIDEMSVMGLNEELNQTANKYNYEALEQGEILKNRTYTVDGKKASKSSDSKDMKAILDELEGLNSFFDMMGVTVDDPEIFRVDAEALLDRLLHLFEKTDNYVSTKNPWFAEGKARYKIVKQINTRVQKDILGMEEKVEDFLKLPEEERKRIKNWGDFLNWERTLSFVNGVDGVEIDRDGGNTSDVIVIKKGDKKYFFKKEEELSPNDISVIMDKKLEELNESLGDKKYEEGSVEEYKYAFLAMFKRDLLRRDTNALFSGFMAGGGYKDFYKGLTATCKAFDLTVNGEVGDLLHSVDQIEDKNKKKQVKKALGELFNSIRKDYILADIGNKTAQIGAGEGMVKRNVAASRLARLLGISEVIPKSEMATVTFGGEKFYGVVMEEAKGEVSQNVLEGKNKPEHKGKALAYSPEAIKNLVCLQIFDILCAQTDRHEGNRMFDIQIYDEEKGIYVVKNCTGIDGDISFGNISYSEISGLSYSGIFSVEDSNGLAAPAISEELAHTILELKPEMLNYEMMGLLNKKERKALVDRLKGLQTHVSYRLFRPHNI